MCCAVHGCGQGPFPRTFGIAYPLAMDLRYGENPIKERRFTPMAVDAALRELRSTTVRNQLQQPGGSDACWDLVQEFDAPL